MRVQRSYGGHLPSRHMLTLAFTALFALVALALFPTAAALQEDLAGKVDWHTRLVGVPLLNVNGRPALSPRTVCAKLCAPGAARNLLVSVSEKNVLAAVNAVDGEIAWRHHLVDSDPAVGVYTDRYGDDNDDILLLSGPGGSTIRMFDKRTGEVRWERVLNADVTRPGDPAWAGTHATFFGKYVVVLSGGRRVTKLNRQTGAVSWSWEFPPGGHSNTFTQVAVDAGAEGTEPAKVILLGYTTQFTAAAVHLLLDFEAVFPITDVAVVSSHTKFDNTLLVRRADKLGWAAVWAEFGRVRVTLIDLAGRATQTVDALPGEEGRRYRRIIDVGTLEDGYLVAELEDGSAAVVVVDEEAKLIAYFEQSEDTKNGAPVYAASGASFSRVAYSFKDKVWVQSILTVGGDRTVASRVEPTHLGDNVVVRHIATTRTPDFVYTAATGALGLHDGANPATQWVRHEALTNLADVHSVDLGLQETEHALEVMEEESFAGRLVRHIIELKDLPAFLISALKPMPALDVRDLKDVPLADELASLQKVIVGVTRDGQAFGISPRTGRVLWNSALGFFSQDGSELEVSHVFVTRNATEAGNPQVGVVAERTRGREVVTLAFHVDARNGTVAGERHPQFEDVPVGKELFKGSAKTAFLTPFVNCCTKNRVLAVVDEEDQLHIFPKCKKVANALEAMGDRLFYSVLENELEGTSLSGYAVNKQEDGMVFSTTQLWTRRFHAQVVLDNIPLTPAATASFGRALGDKSVLYKYLNPHLQVVMSYSPLKAEGHVVVVDSTTGTAVYEADIPHLVGSNVHAAMVENWLVYAWLEAVPGSTAGWRLASVELYDNTAASAGASTLTTVPDLTTFAHTFILPGPVSALGFTTSRFGVTTKDLVFANHAGQVAFLPHSLLNARRPLGNPTPAEAEEGLTPYAPLLPAPGTAIISHAYPLTGVARLTSAPTFLESTSLLLASGIDLFCTAAIQPSGTFDVLGSGFNRVQLLTTLAVLALGVFVAKPAVARKALKEKWF